MKNEDKKCLKRVICFLLVLSFIMAPFMGNSMVKASEVNSKVLANKNEKPTNDANKKSNGVGNGGATSVIQNSYIGEGFEVKFNIDSQWKGAFNGSITITNTGSKTIDNWELTFESKDDITKIWNAVIVSHESNIYKIKNAGWNQDIEPGKSVSFGFGATFENEVTVPTEYRMLGEVQEVSGDKYKITYSIGSQWNAGYVM